jgi:hypothetical protein
MTTKTAIKTEIEYACVQLDVDRFSDDYEFEIVTYNDGTAEIAAFGYIVWEGDAADAPDVRDLVHEVHSMDPADFADWDDLDD